MTEGNTASAGVGGVITTSQYPDPARDGGEVANWAKLSSVDFPVAVIGVLTPFGVVQIVTPDRYSKALGRN